MGLIQDPNLGSKPRADSTSYYTYYAIIPMQIITFHVKSLHFH